VQSTLLQLLNYKVRDDLDMHCSAALTAVLAETVKTGKNYDHGRIRLLLIARRR